MLISTGQLECDFIAMKAGTSSGNQTVLPRGESLCVGTPGAGGAVRGIKVENGRYIGACLPICKRAVLRASRCNLRDDLIVICMLLCTKVCCGLKCQKRSFQCQDILVESIITT